MEPSGSTKRADPLSGQQMGLTENGCCGLRSERLLSTKRVLVPASLLVRLNASSRYPHREIELRDWEFANCMKDTLYPDPINMARLDQALPPKQFI